MQTVTLPRIGTFAAWRSAARALAAAEVPAEAVRLSREGEESDLFAAAGPLPPPRRVVTVPAAFLPLAETVSCHAAPEVHDLLYAALLRLQSTPKLLEDRADPLMHRLMGMEKAVRRDIHKMHAFVRFRELPAEGRRRFAAWFEPDHHIVEAASGFFARRFADMDWVIATPDLTARFEGGEVTLAPPAARPHLPEDAAEGLWQTYFAAIFNPARLKPAAMRAEMPKKYWKNLPEAALIPGMIAGADARARAMQAAMPTLPAPGAARVSARFAEQLAEMRPAVPEGRPETLPGARVQASACTRCPLHAQATQTVFGEGPADAALMIVGEQPGDQEDLAGRPFVGPAGQLFDRLAARAGLDRSAAYVTNAVKHFKFTPRGKRRLHQRPNTGEIQHCRWWLDLEREILRPKLILGMGATAAQALTGRGEGMVRRRGTLEDAGGTPVLLTFHPSYLLRLPDPAARHEAEEQVCADLRQAVRLVTA